MPERCRKVPGAGPRSTSRPSCPARFAKLAPDGYSAAEIGARLGITQRRVQRLAKRHRITLQAGARGVRLFPARISAAALPALDAVAGAAAVSRGEIISRLLAAALEDGGRPAVRLLGADARPKRAYVRQADREAAREAATRAEDAERCASLPEWLTAATAAGQHPLRAVRLHLGLRQSDVAEAAGMGMCGDTRVGELERGSRPLTPRMAGRLAAAFDVDPRWLEE